jgi:S-adenosylmethionine:tRNA ribosyltransferase-isomerase
MRVDLLNYELPADLIAQHPAAEREAAKLLRVPKGNTAPTHHTIADLPSLIPEGSLVVVNDTRVIRARLQGQKVGTGGKVEIFLVRSIGKRVIEVNPSESGLRDAREVDVWRALGKASKALKFGSDVEVGKLQIRLIGRAEDDGLLEVGLWTKTGESVDDIVRALGHVPLPPYIKRHDVAVDAERYQTVFARVDGAIAAPTAGLHLTRPLIGRLALRGCELAMVTLHVGLGTFQPVTALDLDDHPMHAEALHVSMTTTSAIARARAEGRAVVAIGTTVARALESSADPSRKGHVVPTSGETRLLIQPGYAFQVVDHLLTNFHLPKSTLLAMVCAFAGTERVLRAYELAVDARYRFYSYGDAMLLSRNDVS